MRDYSLNQEAATPSHITRDPKNRFVQCTEHYGRIDREFMLREFLTALLPHMVGGTLEGGDNHSQFIQLSNGVSLHFRPEFGAKVGRVEVFACYPREISLRRNDIRLPNLPSATFDAGRPLDKLARDIAGRVIGPAVPLIEGATASVAAFEDKAAEFAARCRSLEGQIPGLRLEVRDKGLEASLWLSTAKGSISGRLNYNGNTWLERVTWSGEFKDLARAFRVEA